MTDTRISFRVIGEDVKLNVELFKGVKSMGELGEGLRSLTTLTAASMKNLLKLSAISDGLMIVESSILICVKVLSLFLLFLIVLYSFCQVYLMFFELASS